jgi:hypothetical protein
MTIEVERILDTRLGNESNRELRRLASADPSSHASNVIASWQDHSKLPHLTVSPVLSWTNNFTSNAWIERPVTPSTGTVCICNAPKEVLYVLHCMKLGSFGFCSVQ